MEKAVAHLSLVFEWPQPEFQLMGIISFNLWGMQFHFMGSQFQLMVQTAAASKHPSETQGYEHPDVLPQLQRKHEPDCVISEPHTPHAGGYYDSLEGSDITCYIEHLVHSPNDGWHRTERLGAA